MLLNSGFKFVLGVTWVNVQSDTKEGLPLLNTLPDSSLVYLSPLTVTGPNTAYIGFNTKR